jgi:serine/threonine protein kinase
VKTKDTNKEFAVKVLLKENKNFEIKIKIINIISSLKSKYIINMIDYGKGPILGNGENQYVVYEYASKGTLFDYFLFPNESSLEEKYAKILFKKILKGIQDMHNIKIQLKKL